MRACIGSRLVVSVSKAVSGAASIRASQSAKAASSRMLVYRRVCTAAGAGAAAAAAGSPERLAPSLISRSQVANS